MHLKLATHEVLKKVQHFAILFSMVSGVIWSVDSESKVKIRIRVIFGAKIGVANFRCIFEFLIKSSFLTLEKNNCNHVNPRSKYSKKTIDNFGPPHQDSLGWKKNKIFKIRVFSRQTQMS